jgi:hypothetical protein
VGIAAPFARGSPQAAAIGPGFGRDSQTAPPYRHIQHSLMYAVSMDARPRIPTSRRALMVVALLLLSSIAAVVLLAMWTEQHGLAGQGSMQPATWRLAPPSPISVTVVLGKDGDQWRGVEIADSASSRDPGPMRYQSNDGDEAYEYFHLVGEAYGTPRVWLEKWHVREGSAFSRWGPDPVTEERRPRNLAARAFLAESIRSGEIPWPTALARKDSCEIWRPWNQFRNGIDQVPFALALPLVPLLGLLAFLLLRRRNPLVCRCGYSLQGLPAAICPECGRPAARSGEHP